MNLPPQVGSVPRFMSFLISRTEGIGPSAKRPDKKGRTGKKDSKADKKRRADDDDETYHACTGTYTLPCPAGSNTSCCDPDFQMCYNGTCYPMV
jgi:hypothetical protein